MTSEKISHRQFSILITATIINTVFLTLPRRIAIAAEWDSPFALLLGYFGAWLVGVFVIWLGLKHPGETFVSYSKKLLGPYLGWLFGLVTLLAVTYINILDIRFAGATYIVAGYTETPIIIFSGATVLLAVWMLKEGIEALARVAEILIVPLILSIVLVSLAVSPKVELNNLLPVLSFGIEPIIRGAAMAFATGLEHVFFVGLLTARIQELDTGAYKYHALGIFWGMMMILVLLVVTIGVFSVDDVKRFWLPPFQLAKIVEIAVFLTGIEILLLAIWTVASLLDVVIFLYVSVSILSQLLNIKYRDIILAWGYLLVSLAMAPRDNHQVEQEFVMTTMYGILPAALVFPIILFPIKVIKDRLKKKTAT
ncbi:MAG: endospore germination permease [Bacillota bacterium]